MITTTRKAEVRIPVYDGTSHPFITVTPTRFIIAFQKSSAKLTIHESYKADIDYGTLIGAGLHTWLTENLTADVVYVNTQAIACAYSTRRHFFVLTDMTLSDKMKLRELALLTEDEEDTKKLFSNSQVVEKLFADIATVKSNRRSNDATRSNVLDRLGVHPIDVPGELTYVPAAPREYVPRDNSFTPRNNRSGYHGCGPDPDMEDTGGYEGYFADIGSR